MVRSGSYGAGDKQGLGWVQQVKTRTCTTGMTKASVFPLPVGADTHRSLGRKPPRPTRNPLATLCRRVGITVAWTAGGGTQSQDERPSPEN